MNVEKQKWAYVWLLPAVLFLLTYLCLGCYYGWTDDVLIMNFMRGILSDRPYPPTDQFRIISSAYIFLYRVFPTVAWYGISLFFFCYLAIVSLFDFFYETLSLYKWGVSAMLFFLIAFYILILAENVYLVNFTRISILLIGASLLCCTRILMQNKLTLVSLFALIYYYGLFMLGYLIRYETAVFPIILGVAFACLLILNSSAGWKRLFIHCSIITILLCSHGLYEYFARDGSTTAYDKKRPYVFNLLDGFNLNDGNETIKTDKDVIRYKAVLEWFYYDDQQITIPFLERMGGKNPWQTNVLLRWKTNLNSEYQKIKGRTENYATGMNLLVKFFCFVLLNLLILLLIWRISLSRRSQRALSIKATLFNLLFYLLFFIATVFIKYEDRVFSPCAVMLIAGNIFFLTEQIKDSHLKIRSVWLWILAIVCVPMMAIRVYEHNSIANEKRLEVSWKENFIKSINTKYTGKIFLYDLWSQTLLHSSAFKNIYLDPHNVHTVFGDLPYHDYDSHQQYLRREVCSYDKFIDFYDCIYDKRDKVIFVMVGLRRDMMQDYLKVLYDRPYKLKAIDNTTGISDIKSSFIWSSLDFGLYDLEK